MLVDKLVQMPHHHHHHHNSLFDHLPIAGHHEHVEVKHTPHFGIKLFN